MQLSDGTTQKAVRYTCVRVHVCIRVDGFGLRVHLRGASVCLPQGCVRTCMDGSEALMHASLCEVRVCVSVSVRVRGWEEAEEGGQRGHCQVSPSSLTSSGEPTGTTGNVIIVGNSGSRLL